MVGVACRMLARVAGAGRQIREKGELHFGQAECVVPGGYQGEGLAGSWICMQLCFIIHSAAKASRVPNSPQTSSSCHLLQSHIAGAQANIP